MICYLIGIYIGEKNGRKESLITINDIKERLKKAEEQVSELEHRLEFMKMKPVLDEVFGDLMKSVEQMFSKKSKKK